MHITVWRSVFQNHILRTRWLSSSDILCAPYSFQAEYLARCPIRTRVAGGRWGCEEVDYMANRWSQVLIVLSPPTYSIHPSTAINLSSPPGLPGLENETATEGWLRTWCILDRQSEASQLAFREGNWLHNDRAREESTAGGMGGGTRWSRTDAQVKIYTWILFTLLRMPFLLPSKFIL